MHNVNAEFNNTCAHDLVGQPALMREVILGVCRPDYGCLWRRKVFSSVIQALLLEIQQRLVVDSK